MIDALLEDPCDYVVAPSGSCIHQVREYLRIFSGDETWESKAKHLADKSYEIPDFIVNVLKVSYMDARLPPDPPARRPGAGAVSVRGPGPVPRSRRRVLGEDGRLQRRHGGGKSPEHRRCRRGLLYRGGTVLPDEHRVKDPAGKSGDQSDAYRRSSDGNPASC
jgi:hypothetical protein